MAEIDHRRLVSSFKMNKEQDKTRRIFFLARVKQVIIFPLVQERTGSRGGLLDIVFSGPSSLNFLL